MRLNGCVWVDFRVELGFRVQGLGISHLEEHSFGQTVGHAGGGGERFTSSGLRRIFLQKSPRLGVVVGGYFSKAW